MKLNLIFYVTTFLLFGVTSCNERKLEVPLTEGDLMRYFESGKMNSNYKGIFYCGSNGDIDYFVYISSGLVRENYDGFSVSSVSLNIEKFDYTEDSDKWISLKLEDIAWSHTQINAQPNK